MSLELTVGDTAPTLAGTVSADLTGSAAVVHIKRPDASVVSRNATIAPGTTGAWSLPLVAGDLTVKGTYYAELQVTFAGGGIQTFAKGTDGHSTSFTVRDQIA